MNFGSQEALDAYLKEHPDADKSNHKVVEKKIAPKAEACPSHLKKTFEDGTVPLRKRLCYGDDVAFMDGKTYHIGTLSEFDEGSGLMEVTLRDGKKLSVPRKDLRMPKGGKRVRDSVDGRIEAFRQGLGANRGGGSMEGFISVSSKLVRIELPIGYWDKAEEIGDRVKKVLLNRGLVFKQEGCRRGTAGYVIDSIETERKMTGVDLLAIYNVLEGYKREFRVRVGGMSMDNQKIAGELVKLAKELVADGFLGAFLDVPDGKRVTIEGKSVEAGLIYAHIWFDEGVAEDDFGHPVHNSGEWQVIISDNPDYIGGREFRSKTFRYADPNMRIAVARMGADWVKGIFGRAKWQAL